MISFKDMKPARAPDMSMAMMVSRDTDIPA
jgi:hypothetical protein